MVNCRPISPRVPPGLLPLVLLSLVQPVRSQAQATPSAAQSAQVTVLALPSALQAQLEKLGAALKTAQAAGDKKGELGALSQLAQFYTQIPDYPQALERYNQALTLARSTKDAQQEAAALNGIASCYRDQFQNSKALEMYQEALDLATSAGDLVGQATALNGLGWVNSNSGQNQKALEFHQKALSLAQRAGDRDLEAAILRRTGVDFLELGERQKALDFYNQALTAYRAVGDRDGEARTLNNIGLGYSDLGEVQKALDSYDQALPVFRAVGDRKMEASVLANIGKVYSALGEHQKALDVYNQVLPVVRSLSDRAGEAVTLGNIGNDYSALGERQKALEVYNQALTVFRSMSSPGGEAVMLTKIGSVYSALGEPQKALDFYNQALPFFQSMGEHGAEAESLNNIGNVYSALGNLQKALDFYNQALPVLRSLSDRGSEAVMLGNIGSVYSRMGESQKALDFYILALPVLRAVGDRKMEALTLTNIGNVYSSLGELQKALDFYNQALPVLRSIGDRDDEATTLNNIGIVYSNLGEKQKALDFFNQALSTFRAVGNRKMEATALINIGSVYAELSELQRALDFYNQALPVLRAMGDHDDEAGTLTDIGHIYDLMGDSQKALDFYNLALPLATAVTDPLMEAGLFDNLMLNRKARQPALAIFYGKEAVNLLQQVRGNIQGLDKKLQSSFLASKGDYYHDLADLLISQGRLSEAQQVLDLLKEQEYRDFVRGESADASSPLALTPSEQKAEQDYQRSTADLVALGEQWAAFKKIGSPTEEQKKRLKELSDRLDAASKGLSDYYGRLYQLFGKDATANRQVADVKGDVSALEDQIAETPHTVALYTMVAKDRYRVIVITATATVAREYAIEETELNQKISDFSQVLRNPSLDPKPLARQLYDILIGPAKEDLEQAKAETLVWSLDGALRYVPIAALYDGEHFVLQKYNTVTITPASIPHLGEQPDPTNLTASAMGISQKYEDGLMPLPAVVSELDDVVKDANVEGANGVFPGTILLNGQFTEAAMEKELDGRRGVVHIASHFVFKPGDDSQSYLLLAGKVDGGAGFHLTVADFRDDKNLVLRHTDLLTLSACQTGMSGNASNGREVDGLGTTAQLKGARAVISSLWSVNDASTGMLMGDFYKRWAEGAGKVTKVEALRKAQLDLLLGKVHMEAAADGRGFVTETAVSDALKGYAHPYYWAPFVLMGNWR